MANKATKAPANKPALPLGPKAGNTRRCRALERLYGDYDGGVGVSNDLLWIMTKNTSSFLVKQPNFPKVLSRDPLNPKGIHNRRFNGLVNDKIMNAVPAPGGKKGVTLVYRKTKDQHLPNKSLCKVVFTHPPRKNLEVLKNFVNANGYRRDLKFALLRKASAVMQAQRTKPPKHANRIKKSRPLFLIPQGKRRRGAATRIKRQIKRKKLNALAKKVLDEAKPKGVQAIKAIKPGTNFVLAKKRARALAEIRIQAALKRRKEMRAKIREARAKGPEAFKKLIQQFREERKKVIAKRKQARAERKKKGIKILRKRSAVFRIVPKLGRRRAFPWEPKPGAAAQRKSQKRINKKFASLPKEKQEELKKKRIERRIKEQERLQKVRKQIKKLRKNKGKGKKASKAAGQPTKKAGKKSKKTAAPPAEAPMETA